MIEVERWRKIAREREQVFAEKVGKNRLEGRVYLYEVAMNVQ